MPFSVLQGPPVRRNSAW